MSAVFLFAFAFGSAAVPAPFGSPKLAFFAAFVLYALVVAAVPALRSSARAWLRVGALDRHALLAATGVSVLSTTALVVYTIAVRPDTSDLRSQLPEKASLPVLALLGFGLSVVNALTEEVAYRGVLQHALESELGPGVLALVVQGFAFAAPHHGHGYPRGPIGVALCTVYGILLGLLRRRVGGLAAPVLAHVTADLTIFAVVLRA